MNFFANLYNQKLAENEAKIRFWEDYVNNLKALDFTEFADKLKVPALIPIGSRILFRGELKHTSEVTVALGADYFAKCSLKQAEVLRQHRIKDAQEKIDMYKKERVYLENQVSLSNEVLHEKQGQEIVEFHTEEEDRVWREKHKENLRIHMQDKTSKVKKETNEINDNELWERLDELELQEELENEFLSMKEDQLHHTNPGNDFIKESFIEVFSTENNTSTLQEQEINNASKILKLEEQIAENESIQVAPTYKLLQKVIDKQNELGERLQELRNKDRSPSRTEIDLIKKLDEMEELDELEDEMERLEDIIEEDNHADTQQKFSPSKTNLARRVSFADELESETLELQFKHSDMEPCKTPFDQEKGIQKPSDIYEAFPHLFSETETTSILKKSKYETKKLVTKTVPKDMKIINEATTENHSESEEKAEADRTIVVKDVIERVYQNDNKLESKSRPTSLFKLRRQQRK